MERLILLAPAFGFLFHWLPRLGANTIKNWQEKQYLPVYHYGEGRKIPLNYDFVTDPQTYKEDLLQRPLPTLILHGKYDEVIPIQASRNFASQHPWVNLMELDSDHALGNTMAEIWQAIDLFSQIA